MRILIVAPVAVPALFSPDFRHGPTPAGLGGSPIVELIGGLRARGHHVTVVTASPDVPKPWGSREDGLDVRVAPFRERARDRALDVFRAEIRGMAALMPTQDEVDVVHAHWTYEFALAAMRVHPNAVITAHDSPFTILRYQPHAYRAIRLAMAAQVRSKARTLTAVSPYLAEKWRRQMLVRRPIEVIPNIAPRLLEGPRRPAPRPTIVSIGDSSSRKNVAVLIESFRLIRDAIGDAELHLAGPGLAADGVLARASEGDPSIHFHGHLDRRDIGELLARSWLMIHPSLEEAQPMSLVEAMAAGLPVLAGAASGGVPWTLGDGIAGVLVDVRDPRAIATAAIDLLLSKARRNEIAEAASDLVVRRFSSEAVCGAYLGAYERVALR